VAILENGFEHVLRLTHGCTVSHWFFRVVNVSLSI
jgi:hypothetical protein